MSEATASGGVEFNPKELKHPTLSFLRDHWNAKRGARAMPSRDDLRPAEMRAHLGWLCMLDVLDGGAEFRYRLIGTMISEYFFWNPTGKTVSEAFAAQPAKLRDAVLGVCRCAVQSRAPLRVYGDAGWAGKGIEECEGLYLPLSSDGMKVDVLLHAFVFDPESVLTARRIARLSGGGLSPAA